MKVIVAALVAASILITAGCERGNVPVRQLAEGEISAILLTDATGIDDRSFNAAAWQGMLDFYGETWDRTPNRGRLYDVLTATTMADYDPNLRLAVDEGFDLIIATGFTWREALAEVAVDYPGQNFLIVDVAGIGLPNVMEAIFAEHEGSFLVGAAAALQALEEGIENPRFGFIGGMPGALITRFHVGFVQGVLSVIPGADVLDFYVNSWGEPALARTQAMAWYGDGVFAIFSAAGASGNGTIAEARDRRMAGQNVWAIGVDSDQFEEGRYSDTQSAVLTSMIKRVESSVVYALAAVEEGNFYGRTIVFDLPMEGVGFSTTNPALSPRVIAQVNEIRDRIISGDIVVVPTLAEAMRIPGFPQDLMAIDG
ncbi:MAG: BMP family ABC transporter substrate-binding protein [Treponema sp.]|nr:BMP family ABC transporter substrate-binding protein [Treponema sp.]